MKRFGFYLIILTLGLGILTAGCANNDQMNGTNQETNQTGQTNGSNGSNEANEDNNPVIYQNTVYGFDFTLPDSWKGYSIVTEQWEGIAVDGPQSGQVIEMGQLIRIRHPLWTSEQPRQDIPIMIFTLDQWTDLLNEKFSVGAAPMPPSELGRNSRYVLALPARYNYAFPEGFEEVEDILANSPLEAAENFK
ncbi:MULTISPECIES: hypothetical protein [Dehalobacter]|jgi:hypothetical protein|uniref:Uncharacterized protein n=2 Tax=Dehalobacter restrictus TaxID=55583 RepID=A0A857DJQ6_9FIRM|nr:MULTISPECIES: hypothetical protein [Dehalobacter]AHF10249.1 hypothetical protein DEHRE_09280 [Dehalobacter restrictus DSM 9455]MCG1024256.1 hypothetical protein [Dehalobacter sp.]MDJ0306965.1 hypothetical protein [Dehalobacter sp.]OCZ49548.1 hypothetical protein A7D23_03600 [Dehalobacter sp. TeCB1]QHA00838.1 hypothetical protein GQ588_09430 [Dehalobacter restrictus]